MIVILKPNADKNQVAALENWILERGLVIHRSEGASSTLLGLVGDTSKIDIDLIFTFVRR